MNKLKIKPVNIEKASSVRGVSRNIGEVLDFQINTAQEINRVVSELNQLLPTISEPYDDEAVRLAIAYIEKAIEPLIKDALTSKDKDELKSEITKVKKSVPVAYDDSKLIAKLNAIVKSIPAPYDDGAINKKLGEIKASIPKVYDDSKLASRIKALESVEVEKYNDKPIIERLSALERSGYDDSELKSRLDKLESKPSYDDSAMLKNMDFIGSILKEHSQALETIEALNKSLALNQAEMRSLRNNLGGQIDEMRRKLDKLTEIK